jgi:hypothetical protein
VNTAIACSRFLSAAVCIPAILGSLNCDRQSDSHSGGAHPFVHHTSRFRGTLRCRPGILCAQAPIPQQPGGAAPRKRRRSVSAPFLARRYAGGAWPQKRARGGGLVASTIAMPAHGDDGRDHHRHDGSAAARDESRTMRRIGREPQGGWVHALGPEPRFHVSLSGFPRRARSLGRAGLAKAGGDGEDGLRAGGRPAGGIGARRDRDDAAASSRITRVGGDARPFGRDAHDAAHPPLPVRTRLPGAPCTIRWQSVGTG